MSTALKAAGVTFLQQLNISASALRQSVKPALQAKYTIKEDVHYKKQTWTAGKVGEKVYFTGSIVKPVLGYTNPTGHLAAENAELAKEANKA